MISLKKRTGPVAPEPRSIPTASTIKTVKRYRKAKQPTSLAVLRAVRQDGSLFIVRGQPARTLAALVEAGSQGVTAQEVASWAFRLAAYVHTLRTVHLLPIETLREPHETGWHGRYVLHAKIALGGVL